ncbi:MAG: hypothetical protein M3176_10755 [Chloroflexota bacterium]|nr:hypothetical protein [Chloroflexota bacterium]
MALLFVSACLMATPLRAASSFASPAFQSQWQAGEAITPNFWGPLPNAKDGQQEPYKEEASSSRLVQYFDKGRMELTNGSVTNGLLATDLVKGQVQVGDTTFQPKPAPAIPIAGDSDNTFPTYAQLGGTAASLLAPATAQPGNGSVAAIVPNGTVVALATTVTGRATIGGFDDATRHNVPGVFVDYRNKAGLPTIGYALSEPFIAMVKVAGQPKQVEMQVFERRVLTYTESNPDAFKVEMGNVGQHYYQWRSATPAPATSVTPTTSPTSVATVATPTATTATASGVTFLSVQGNTPGGAASVAVKGPPSAQCAITYTTPAGAISTVSGLGPKTTTTMGLTVWNWTIESNTRAGTGMVLVQCSGGVSATTTIKIG